MNPTSVIVCGRVAGRHCCSMTGLSATEAADMLRVILCDGCKIAKNLGAE